LSFITSGKLQQNAFVESLNVKFRKECLDLNAFANLIEAREVSSRWKDTYNTIRPHSSLDYLSLLIFREAYEKNAVSKCVTS